MTQPSTPIPEKIEKMLQEIIQTIDAIQEGITDLKIGQIRMENEIKRELRAVGEKVKNRDR